MSSSDLAVPRVETRSGYVTYVSINDDEGPVSQLNMRRLQMRVGGGMLTVGGIGAVWTRGSERLKGYMHRVMGRALEWLDEAGFHAAFLFGIPNLYERWGFAPIYGNSWLSITTSSALRAPYTHAVRPFRPEDMPGVLDIYNAQNRTRTCSVVRPPFPKDRFPKGSQYNDHPRVIVSVTHRGRITGYAVIDDYYQSPEMAQPAWIADRVTVSEVGASDPDAYGSLLREAASQATELGVDEVTAHLPLDHPFAIYCRQWGTCTHATHPDSGQAMARIINVPRCLSALRGELQSRLLRAGITDAQLWVETENGSAGLYHSDGRLVVRARRRAGSAHLSLPPQLLLQGLLGVRTGEVLLTDGSVCASGNARRIVEALYPLDTPYMWSPDHF